MSELIAESANSSLPPIPEWLSKLREHLFENISPEKAATWPARFDEARAGHNDLEKAKGPFLIAALERARQSNTYPEARDVIAAVDRAIWLWKRPDIGSKQWIKETRDAAWVAARVEAPGGREQPKFPAWVASAALLAAIDGETCAVLWAASWASKSTWGPRVLAYDYLADDLIRAIENTKRGLPHE